ncbi:MAG: hypothetical protein IBX70_10835 [Clostridia bacterium]|nr:hypothetical protein [Clostridia bacterium]
MDDIVILIEKLMAEYSNDLKRTAYVMLGDEQLSEDVTQETFISFLRIIINSEVTPATRLIFTEFYSTT